QESSQHEQDREAAERDADGERQVERRKGQLQPMRAFRDDRPLEGDVSAQDGPALLVEQRGPTWMKDLAHDQEARPARLDLERQETVRLFDHTRRLFGAERLF